MNIALRRVEQRDWEGFLDYLRDDDVGRFLGAGKPEQQFQDLCQRETNGQQVFAIVDATTDRFIGVCGLWPAPAGPPDLELCVGVAVAYRRRGVAKRACQLVLERASTGDTRIFARVEAGNGASKALVRSLGLAYVGPYTGFRWQAHEELFCAQPSSSPATSAN